MHYVIKAKDKTKIWLNGIQTRAYKSILKKEKTIIDFLQKMLNYNWSLAYNYQNSTVKVR